MKRMWHHLFSAAVVFSITCVGLADDKDKPPKEKEAKSDVKKAPDFTLKDLDGKTHALKDYKGKWVVLEWANKDCPVWRARLKELKSTAAKFKENKDVVWLLIDSTYAMVEEDNKKYMKENEVTRPVLVDRDGKVGKAYDARTTPHMFIIDKEGNIAYDGAIDNQKKDKEFVNYVSKAMDERLAGKPVSTPKTNPYGCSVKYKR